LLFYFLFPFLFSVLQFCFWFLFEFHIWIQLFLQVSQLLILSRFNILTIMLLFYLNKHFIWDSIAHLWFLFKMLNRHELILLFWFSCELYLFDIIRVGYFYYECARSY
jgi:hypothetical protein